MPTESIVVAERDQAIAFTFEDMMRFHGPGSPAGVACAFKALQRAVAELSPDRPPERRSVSVRTAFRGPGARDGFEMVTRAVSDDRYLVDRTLLRSDRGILLEDFVFEVTIGTRSVTLVLREGFVTEEFIRLARADDRTPAEERRFVELKAATAARIIGMPAEQVFEVV
jgi:hypothetical protein